MINSGIYIILNVVNYKIYVGSTINFGERKNKHFSDLRINRHHCMHLQYSFNKHFEENFRFIIYERFKGTKEEIYDLEQIYLNKWFGKDFCYNLNPNASGGNGLSGKDHPMFGKTGKNNSKSEPIIINGIYYESILEASKILEINRGTLGDRLLSSNFSNIQYVNEEKRKKQIKRRPNHKGKNNPRARAVIIDNKYYDYGSDAARELDVSSSTIHKRLKSPKYPNYQYADEVDNA
ncbi:MAG: GIY-YIG nuclease family protein, partial [Romboutsia sp.]|nr:GIY-YIG nuclease family protein [Romboutsia sp.]